MPKKLNLNLINSSIAFTFIFSGLLFFGLSSNAMGVFQKAKLKLRSWRAGQGQKDSGEQENKEQELEDQVVDSGLQEKITLSHYSNPYSWILAIYYAKIETKHEIRERTVTIYYHTIVDRIGRCRIEDNTTQRGRKKANQDFSVFPDKQAIQNEVRAAIEKYRADRYKKEQGIII